jgi:hypothetical protein
VSTSGPTKQLLVDTACPGTGIGYGYQTGPQTVVVVADGPWTLHVEQQVDAPLEQAPLAATIAPGSTVALTGAFYGIDQQGQGRVTIYRLADGTYAMRLTNFYVTPNSDLEIRLSRLRSPHTTGDYMSNPSVHLVALPITAGSLNLAVPIALNPTSYGSVVIWCERLVTAYAAATLEPG